jgi:hypothetical protein
LTQHIQIPDMLKQVVQALEDDHINARVTAAKKMLNME